jgi:hypothetical protein
MPIPISALKDLLNEDRTEDHKVTEWNTLICKVTDEQLDFIKGTIKNSTKTDVIDVIIEFDEQELKKMADIIATLPDNNRAYGASIWSDYLFFLIYKGIMKNPNADPKATELTLEQLSLYQNLGENQNVQAYHEMTSESKIYRYFNFWKLNDYIKNLNKIVVLHFVSLDKVIDLRLQIAINQIVAQRGDPTVRIYTKNDFLITRATNPIDGYDHPIEMTHDFTFYHDGIDETVIAFQKKKIIT